MPDPRERFGVPNLAEMIRNRSWRPATCALALVLGFPSFAFTQTARQESPDVGAKLAFSDGQFLHAIGENRAILYSANTGVVPIDERLEERAHSLLRASSVTHGEVLDAHALAVTALGSFKSDENVRLLTGLLGDSDDLTRQEAYQVQKGREIDVAKPSSREQTPDSRLQSKLNAHVRTYTVEANTYRDALSRIAADFHIPIGIAWVYAPDAQEKVNLSWSDATVWQIIEDVARTQPGYSLEVADGVVHISPAAVPAGQNFLTLKLPTFAAKGTAGEVKHDLWMQLNQIVFPRKGGYLGSVLSNPDEPDIHLQFTNATVETILDGIATASNQKIWIVTFENSSILTATGFRRTFDLDSLSTGPAPDDQQPEWTTAEWGRKTSAAPEVEEPTVSPEPVRPLSQLSGKCLEATSAPGKLVAATQQTYDDTSAQQWSFKTVVGGCQIISALASSSGLNLRGATKAQGARVRLSERSATGTLGETWNAVAVANDYNLIASHNEKCMDVSQGSTADGVAIPQYTCHGSRNQIWTVQTVASSNFANDPAAIVNIPMAAPQTQPSPSTTLLHGGLLSQDITDFWVSEELGNTFYKADIITVDLVGGLVPDCVAFAQPCPCVPGDKNTRGQYLTTLSR